MQVSIYNLNKIHLFLFNNFRLVVFFKFMLLNLCGRKIGLFLFTCFGYKIFLYFITRILGHKFKTYLVKRFSDVHSTSNPTNRYSRLQSIIGLHYIENTIMRTGSGTDDKYKRRLWFVNLCKKNTIKPRTADQARIKGGGSSPRNFKLVMYTG